MSSNFSGSGALTPDDSRPGIERIRSVECPKCSKHTIVSTQSGFYECLSCGFKHSNDPGLQNKSGGGLGEALLAIGGFLLVAALIL